MDDYHKVLDWPLPITTTTTVHFCSMCVPSLSSPRPQKKNKTSLELLSQQVVDLYLAQTRGDERDELASEGSYQDLSVAAYELLQRLHHLLPVLRLLKVGVARSVGFLDTEE